MRTATRSCSRLAGLILLAALVARPGLAETVSFAAAVARVQASAPETSAAAARLEGAREAERRSGTLPDPSLDIELEDFGGSGSTGGFDRAELTVSARQPLEFGPRLSARRAQASAGTRLAEAEAGAGERQLIADLAVRYAAADAAGRRLALARDQAALSAKRKQDADRRLAAGLIPELEAQHIVVADARARVMLTTAEAEARQTMAALARLLGVETVKTDPQWLDSLVAAPIPGADAEYADMRLWRARAEAADAEAKAAAAAGKPSVDVRVGVRRNYDVDGTSGVAGLGVALPLWNGNRAAIARARAEANAMRFEAERSVRDASDRRDAAAGRIASETARLATIRSAALPAAKRAMELSERGWRAGALDWRDLADATEALFATRAAEIAALEAIALARAELLREAGDRAILGV